MALSGDTGASAISLPALIPVRAGFSRSPGRAPRMLSASVKQSPRKPSFFRRISVTIVGESEAARLRSPPLSAGTLR